MFSDLHIFLFTIIIIISIVSAQWFIEEEGCRTPDNDAGNCIPLQDCRPITEVLRQIQRQGLALNRDLTARLQSYQCGTTNGRPNVCCPFKPVVLLQDVESEPPDVSRHRNLARLPYDCGQLSSDYRVINGYETGLFDFPWMALLYFRRISNQKEEFACGGTVINANYILTAAHCITEPDFILLSVRVGDHNTSSPIDCEQEENGEEVCAPSPQDLRVLQKIPHPEYSRTSLVNDIALLRVSPIDLTVENVKPVCLPLGQARTYNFTGKNAIVTGFGRTERARSSEVLLRVDVPVLDLPSCRRSYANVKNVRLSEKQLCAGAKDNKDSCEGDSGGPLHVPSAVNGEARFVQQGIVSFGPQICALNDRPAVYTRVAYYMDWILDNLKN